VLKDKEVMSKSRGNTVDPDSMIKDYGADALRLFILFAAPPETELEWDERGLEGAFKFLNRVWRVHENLKSKAEDALVRNLHKTIKKVSEDFSTFKFNTAIASLMELTNAIYQSGADIEVFSKLIIMLSPIAPHFSEELWEILGNKESIFKAPWPKYDPKLLVEENVELVIQVNGRVRSKIEVPRDTPEDKLKELVLKDEKLILWLEGKTPKKFIVVPQRLVNIVI
ncbi:MAG: class I tRNA ligase family protein, partial [Candidatus Omnitrophota bacterium]|nr:class I tRNA ligase family protein [Candidatus Omnitrophota bacterium]